MDENTELRKVVEVLSSNQNQLGTELIDLKVCVYISTYLHVSMYVHLTYIMDFIYYPFN